MRYTDKEIAEFNPPMMMCSLCKDLLRSSYPGEFVMCKCEKSFVDQTPYYSRFGGHVVKAESDDNEKRSEGSHDNSGDA